VSSSVKKIISFLEASVEAAVPSLYKSSYYFDLERNAATREAHIYAIRPGRANPISGTNHSVTLTQDFEIEICREYFASESNDKRLRDAVDEIYRDNEKIQKEISLRRFENILLIEPPSFSAPEIKPNGRSVSIIFTYPIIYRNSVKGAS